MNSARSLAASAETFDRIGEPFSADMCRQMLRDCVSADTAYGEGAGDAMFRHWASAQAARAWINLIRFNRKQQEAA